MPKTTVLIKSKYQKLLADLRKLISESKRRAEEAVSRELVVTYWEVGKRITEEGLTENAGYGTSIMEDLSDALGVNVDTLERSVVFFDLYNNSAPRGGNLTWSHYRELIRVRQDNARAWYFDLINTVVFGIFPPFCHSETFL